MDRNIIDNFKLKIQGKSIVLIDWANIYNQQKKLGWKIDLKILFKWLKSHSKIDKIIFFHGTRLEDERSSGFLKSVEKIGYQVITKDVKYIKTDIKSSAFREKLKILKKNIEYGEGVIKGLGEWERENGVPIFTKDGFAYMKSLEDFEIELENTKTIYKEISKEIIIPKCDFDVEIVTELMKNFTETKTFILFSGDGDFAYPISHCLEHDKEIKIISASFSLGKEIRQIKNIHLNKDKLTILNLKKLDFIQKSFPR